MLVAGDLASGNLVLAFDREVESAGAHYLLCRERQADQPRVKAFREWLAAECDRPVSAP